MPSPSSIILYPALMAFPMRTLLLVRLTVQNLIIEIALLELYCSIIPFAGNSCEQWITYHPG